MYNYMVGKLCWRGEVCLGSSSLLFFPFPPFAHGSWEEKQSLFSPIDPIEKAVELKALLY